MFSAFKSDLDVFGMCFINCFWKVSYAPVLHIIFFLSFFSSNNKVMNFTTKLLLKVHWKCCFHFGVTSCILNKTSALNLEMGFINPTSSYPWHTYDWETENKTTKKMHISEFEFCRNRCNQAMVFHLTNPKIIDLSTCTVS